MAHIELIENNQHVAPDFTLKERIGKGGFGSIYKIEGDFDTPAVIKFGNEDIINEYSMYTILQKIIPMNIPKYFRFGECMLDNNHQYFIIIEYIKYSLFEGDSPLYKQLSNDSIVPIYMNIYNEIVDILNNIHQHGFVHKDIKPQNILIKQLNGVYIPILIDFGLLDTVIPIFNNHTYFAGTRCYSSIYQHFGQYATPIDDFINLVYTWMKVFSIIFKSNRCPWDSTFISQDKKKHEFYAYEKWKYLSCFDPNNFYDRILKYLYNLQHFWTTVVDLKKIYYIDPLTKFNFEIHTIETPSHWQKIICKEGITIGKQHFISDNLKEKVCIDEIITFIKKRLNRNTLVNIADYSLTFSRYMIKQYNTLVNYMWDNLKKISEEFMSKCSKASCTYMYKWLGNIQKALNDDINVFNSMLSSINTYQTSEIYSFFNYRRIQEILDAAIAKLPSENDIFKSYNSELFVDFYRKLDKLYAREL